MYLLRSGDLETRFEGRKYLAREVRLGSEESRAAGEAITLAPAVSMVVVAAAAAAGLIWLNSFLVVVDSFEENVESEEEEEEEGELFMDSFGNPLLTLTIEVFPAKSPV